MSAGAGRTGGRVRKRAAWRQRKAAQAAMVRTLSRGGFGAPVIVGFDLGRGEDISGTAVLLPDGSIEVLP